MVILVAGCSTEKNTFVTRSYHNITAHYNVYYNGKVSLLEGVDRINSSVDDDYSNILPIFKSSNPGTATTAKGSMENAIQKASKLIQSHSITKKPKRKKRRTKSYLKLAKKEEYNNWIDDAYILMGQAYFYQHSYNSALENFSYTIRKFGEEKSKYDAYIWMIRCYTEMERFVEALEIIQLLQGDPEFPGRLEEELAIVTADYYAKKLNYKEGIPYLSIAAKKTHKKTNKLRYKYILAQWYNEVGNSDKASQIFREVARMNPPYEMAFNARISAAGTFTGKGDSEKLKKALRKMLKDSKNKEYLDQIYFALGNISMKEGNRNQAIEYYIKSAASSVDNMYQRAHSCLTLAQIYFDDLEYKNSQSYYDSAMIVIDNNYPDYELISERYASLTRLVENLFTVEREDSLQRIAAMDEVERNKLIDKWIKEAAEKEQLAQQQEVDQMMNSNYYRSNQGRLGLGQEQQGAAWYFYNPSMVAYGKVEFERIWGRRKLEDGWRLSDKTTFTEDEEYVEGDSLVVEKTEVVKVTDPKTKEYYTQDLPINDSLLALSNERIRDALFYAGRIFKTEFQDYPRSIESYKELNERFPDNIYKLSSYFELWGLYKEINNIETSNHYKNQIIELYPESKYAKYLINPNYFIELKAKQDTVDNMYQKAFYKFKAGDYSEAGKIAKEIHNLAPDSVLNPKIDFFSAIAEGSKSDWNTFGKILKDYQSKYPKAETTSLVERILKLIEDSTLVDYQQLVESGYLNDQIQNVELIDKNDPTNDEFDGKFSYDEGLLHYYVIAFPKESKIDLNRLKFDIANYNIDHYTKSDFDIETENLNTNVIMVVVRSLIDKEQSLIYFRSIIRARDVFESLEGVKYVNFVASSTNYREILADKEYNEYLKFFIKNYSRYIGTDYPKDEIPEPEELIAEVQAKEDEFEEKGTFVMVKSQPTADDNYEGIYSGENEGTQNFVIAVNAPDINIRALQSSFAGYNDNNYSGLLKMSLRQMGEYQLLIVRPFEDKISALRYFTDVVSNRRLFRSLDTLGYRNFTITDANLEKLLEAKDIESYLDFFKIRYLGISGGTESSVDESKDSETQPVKVYNGPYNQEINGKQIYVLILPSDQVDQASLIQSIKQFNSQNYDSSGLKVVSQMIDDFRLMITVENLEEKETGMSYLRSLASDEGIYGQIQDANYRNFIISTDNFRIFMQDKNILIYMDFYKQFYLGK